MLRASAGIDFLEFVMLLTQIASVQMTRVIGSQKARQNFNLELFNLSKITQVLELILKENYMMKYKTLSDNIFRTIEKIANFVVANKS
jgi:ssRNA-specific RNase YbeY (16S rRNA maturation enzyme)